MDNITTIALYLERKLPWKFLIHVQNELNIKIPKSVQIIIKSYWDKSVIVENVHSFNQYNRKNKIKQKEQSKVAGAALFKLNSISKYLQYVISGYIISYIN